MALIKYITATQPAGSTNGLTMYKNGGQLAMRSRAYPLRNKSQAHIVPMNAIAVLSMLWESPLTNADRIAWGNYAFATPLTDAYGNPIYVKGYAHFMRVNRPLLQHGLPLQLTAPSTTGYPTFSPMSMATAAGTTTVTVTINNADAWATATGAHAMLWISRPRSPRRRYPPEVYKPLGKIAGNTTTPPPINDNFTNPWGSVTQQAVQWLRPSIIDVHGRLSQGTNAADPQPKIMGTVSPPILQPCTSVTSIAYDIGSFPWTKSNNPILGCVVQNGTFTTPIHLVGNHITGWSASVPSTLTITATLVFNCSDPPTAMRADFFLQNFNQNLASQWHCPSSNNGIGTYTATDSCTRPVTITVIQV